MATPSILIVPDRYKSGVLYSQLPENGAVDFDVTRATPAFRTNASGILDSTASGVPRLDYPAAGGCPALLVEPAATNLTVRSQEFNDAHWFPFNLNAFGSGSVANTTGTLDPYGTNVADYIQENTAAGAHSLIAIFAGNVSGTTYTFSVFAKAAERNIVNILNNAGGGGNANFNLTTGVATLTTGVSASIENYGNGWYRCRLTYTSTATGNHNIQIRMCDAGGNVSYTGTGTSGLNVFGAQLETGSVATSYIPTTTAAVTRNADVISKTGVSGFIGQTVGTLYAEVDVRNFQADGRILAISNGTSDNRIALLKGANSTLRGLVTTASGSVADIATASGRTAGVYKIALAYAADDFVLYVNGSQIGTDTSGAVPACTDVYLGKIETSGTTNQLNDRIRAAAIYTNRLSNTELAALTSL
jgi:hypothetical protein